MRAADLTLSHPPSKARSSCGVSTVRLVTLSRAIYEDYNALESIFNDSCTMTARNKLLTAPPYPVEKTLKGLGANLRTARLRRNLTI